MTRQQLLEKQLEKQKVKAAKLAEALKVSKARAKAAEGTVATIKKAVAPILKKVGVAKITPETNTKVAKPAAKPVAKKAPAKKKKK